MKQALADLEINTKNFPPASMLGSISNAKNDLLDAAGFAKQADNFYDRTVAKVYTKYESILERNAALDFDDLIARTVALLEAGDAARWVLFKLDGGIEHILVDEAQDTSPDQWSIVSKLAEPFFDGESTTETTRTVFAVGDVEDHELVVAAQQVKHHLGPTGARPWRMVKNHVSHPDAPERDTSF